MTHPRLPWVGDWTIAANNSKNSSAYCAQLADKAANQLGDALPGQLDFLAGGAGVAIGVATAVASAPEDGPLVPIVYSAVRRGITGFVVGLFKDTAVKSVIKAWARGSVYSACVSPQSQVYQGVAVP